ncbi:MAG: dephospho-CoA kinase [Mesotoga sp.]|jgi:dephospho-CoA kinase|uniref:dephospho-CoA kinase n=1 Tax=Mesotoga sp. TaxID=2053577 RepID=UPI0026253D14|nr:dephospho-CoA kinase [Mesotoga sp.]MDD5681737.1 dephospho-CoA kinase [Mesotoga sp.]
MVVGFVGKAGSGKSTAAERFERFGAEIISLDKLGHDALEEEKKQMVDSFGKSILTCDKVDRKKLSKKVFEDSKLLQKLDEILHPVIRRKALKALERCHSKLCIIDGALIHEIGLADYCDKVIWFECTNKSSVERLMKRGMSRVRAESILHSQSHLDSMKERVNAEVSTSGSIDETFEKVREVLFEWGVVV